MCKSLGIALFLGALSVAPLAGCYTNRDNITVIGGVIYKYPVNATADQAIGAAREVARELSLTEVTFSSTREEGWLVATDNADLTYEFRSESNGDRTSDISVRVGSSGNKQKSYDLIDRIKAKL